MTPDRSTVVPQRVIKFGSRLPSRFPLFYERFWAEGRSIWDYRPMTVGDATVALWWQNTPAHPSPSQWLRWKPQRIQLRRFDAFSFSSWGQAAKLKDNNTFFTIFHDHQPLYFFGGKKVSTSECREKKRMDAVNDNLRIIFIMLIFIAFLEQCGSLWLWNLLLGLRMTENRSTPPDNMISSFLTKNPIGRLYYYQ